MMQLSSSPEWMPQALAVRDAVKRAIEDYQQHYEAADCHKVVIAPDVAISARQMDMLSRILWLPVEVDKAVPPGCVAAVGKERCLPAYVGQEHILWKQGISIRVRLLEA